MLIWYFCEPQDITFTHKPLDTHDKGYQVESYQNLINGLFENLETLDITGVSDFFNLLPLYCSGGFTCYIIDYSVDMFYFVDDTVGDSA